MDKLPAELVDWILQACVSGGRKNDCLSLRLVCRSFDRLLRPITLKTLNIEFSKLSKRSPLPRPRFDALQTIGHVCKNLYLDTMILRDELEFEWLDETYRTSEAITTYVSALNRRYTMNEDTFTEAEYHHALQEVLFYCRDIEKLRVNLPNQLTGGHINVATRILANTLKAFASRPEEDSAPLKTLVLENVTDIAICQLWMNPVDVMYIRKVFSEIESLYLTLQEPECLGHRAVLFASSFSNILETAEYLTTLCIVGVDKNHRPGNPYKLTDSSDSAFATWVAMSLPLPMLSLPHLKRLELRRLDIVPLYFHRMIESYGSTLEELFLNQVYLKVEIFGPGQEHNHGTDDLMWTGRPNTPQSPQSQHIATMMRVGLPHLRICRASFLGYDVYFHSGAEQRFTAVDTEPPSLETRETDNSLEQRFVEIVTGIEQPCHDKNHPVIYHPPSEDDWERLRPLVPRSDEHDELTAYDANAYQIAVANTTSHWAYSMDGVFRNINPRSIDELGDIADEVRRGMAAMPGQSGGANAEWWHYGDDDDPFN